MTRTMIAVVVSLLAARLAAQSPAHLVKDINVSVAPDTQSSSPVNFVRLGSRILFAATTAQAGAELWSTDGTPGGTSMVRDIMPGYAPSYPRNFAALNGSLFFAARDARGEELWVTDGTAKGTRLIADICAGTCSSSPRPLFVHGTELLFSADNRIVGSELWITDGTPVGTRLFKDLAPGTNGSYPGSFAVLNDVVYFAATGALWKTDGTPDGTVKVKTQSAYNLRVAGSRLFFTSYTEGSGTEPWVSDGTEAGTRMIRDIRPGANGSVIGSLTSFGDRALFTADDGVHGAEPWITDGTEAGTHALRDIDPGPGSGLSQYRAFTVAGGLAYFNATDANGPELWRTDGTEAGTSLVRDIVPGKEGSNPTALTEMGGKVFFLVFLSQQRKLWVTDGTEGGTRPVQTSDAPSVSIASNIPDDYSYDSPLTPIDGTLYFSAKTLATGLEPWKSDGTDAGTAMIANLVADPAANANPDALVAAADLLFFQAWDGSGTLAAANDGPRSFWRSDGTAEGTVKLLPAVSDSYVAAGRSVFFKGNDGRLWRSDGTSGGTGPAIELAQRFPGTPTIAYTTGDKLFVNVVRNGQSELWFTTTGSNAPATALGTSSGTKFCEFAGRTVFVNESGLWITDGTPAGTHLMMPLLAQTPLPAPTVAGPIAVMGGNLYFAIRTPQGVDLWKSDGTLEGSVIIRSLPAAIDAMVPTGRKLFFACNGVLWTTDGSETRSLALIEPTSTSVAPLGDRVVFASRLLARAEPGNVPQPEPWISDGTEEGTHELRDIVPGLSGSNPDDFLSVDGVVYFTAAGAAGGRELWSTDGTPEGTTLVADIEPGPKGSSPRQLRRAGNRLFFVATTTATGVELWAVPLSAAPVISIGDTRVAETDGGSAASFVVTLSPASAQAVKVGFATSDGTAVAGADYDAASGTLVFAPGETSKTIVVAVRDDAITENNESFLVTLSHAEGAAVLKPEGFAAIEDNEEKVADLSASLDLSQLNPFHLIVDAANSGPWMATEIKLAHTATPIGPNDGDCVVSVPIFKLAPGSKAQVFDHNVCVTYQQYKTATVTARQRDPQPSNNSVAWIQHFGMGMDDLYLTPGTQATAWVFVPPNVTTLSAESSSPSVISVPSSIANGSAGPLMFTVRGAGVGKATIRVFAGTATYGTLDIEVVPAGAKPRFPGGIVIRDNNYNLRFDQPAVFDVYSTATAPFSGATATGVFTISIEDHQVGRLTLASGETRHTFSTYLPLLGLNHLRFEYSGDENFLPQTMMDTLTASRGSATILGTAARSADVATVHVHVGVVGSPLVSPGGWIYAVIKGTGNRSQTVALPSGATGDAQADLTIANVDPASRIVTVYYLGDANYTGGLQDVGIRDTRGRAAGHR